MANPNILSISHVVNVSVSTPQSGLASYKLNNIAYFTKETPLVTVTDYAVYRSADAVATDWGTASEVYQAAVVVFSQSPCVLSGDGQFIVAVVGSGATLTDAAAALNAKAFFGGFTWGGYAPVDAEIQAAGVWAQANKKLLVAAFSDTASVETSGIVTTIKNASLKRVRCLLYTVSALKARLAAAAYLSRLFSVDFTGSNTTATMNLKNLVGIDPDPNISETVLTKAQTAGADVYVSLGGSSGTIQGLITTGTNGYSDEQYNLLWFVFAIETNGVNALATTSTKLPQTEEGMEVLKNAYIEVCEQARTNGFIAAGTWNSPELIGNVDDMRRNISEQGYYIYSQPITQQSQTDRDARKAPLIQLAIKLAGAFHSSDVLVYLNR